MGTILLSMVLFGAGEVNFSELTEPKREQIVQKEIIKSEVSTDLALRQSLEGGQRYNDWLNRSRGGYYNSRGNRGGLFSRLRR